MVGLVKWGAPKSRRVPYLAQMELAECGAACLSMVLAAHGCHVPLAEMRVVCGVSRDGVSARAILSAARLLGCNASGVRITAGALSRLPLPAILHWNDNHFVVLERTSRRGAVIVDPARGRATVDRATLARCFSGVALRIEPAAGFAKRARVRGALVPRDALRRFPRPFTALLASTLLLELAGIMAPAANQLLIDHVIVAKREDWIMVLLGALAAAMSVRTLLQWLRERLLLGLQAGLDLELTSRFVDHLFHLPITYFDQRTAGDLAQRVDANAHLRVLTLQLGRGLLDVFLLLVYGALMLAFDLRLGAVVLTLNVARITTVLLLSRAGRVLSALELTARGREQGAAVEAFGVPEVVKATGSEHALLKRFDSRLAERLGHTFARQSLSARVSAVSALGHAVCHGLVFYLGGVAVTAHEMTIGTLAGFLTLQQLIGPSLDAITAAFAEVAQVGGMLARMEDVFATPRAQDGNFVAPRLRGEITFENVSFRYGPASPWIVQDLSFHIQAGEKVALAGQSGHGKSTILRLLLGLIVPDQGRVLIDGIDLARFDRAQLMTRIGVVMQDSFLIDADVRANLALGAPDASDGALWSALKLASIDDVITALPRGMDTPLGASGARLSGGQRQRLCLARALAGKPDVLVLDESTSALDELTEGRIQHRLSQVACTRVVVAHRVAALRDTDRILVIERGRLIDEGTYSELASRPGLVEAIRRSCA